MIGLLLPLWLNLRPTTPAEHHDAPGIRYMMPRPDSRAIAIEPDPRLCTVATHSRGLVIEADSRALAVPPDRRELHH
jgi:hypothetical protein